MNKEIAKRICEQMTEDIDNLCHCPRKDEKIIDCYGCRELAIKTLLDYINQLETNISTAIDFIDIYTDGINLGAFDCLKLMYKVKEILEGGKE